jgi:hypothetical protein
VRVVRPTYGQLCSSAGISKRRESLTDELARSLRRSAKVEESNRSTLDRSSRILRHIVNPRSSERKFWDFVVFVILLVDCLEAPFIASFASDIKRLDLLFVQLYFVDILFALDIYLTSCTLTVDKTQEYIDDSILIRKMYFASNESRLDFFGIIPVELCFITMGFTTFLHVRMLRIIRFYKVVRYVLRAGSNIRLNNTLVGIICCTMLIVMVSHFSACLWHSLALLQDTSRYKTLSWLDVELEKNGGGKLEAHPYIIALYWSMTTMTTT